jgi:hypothetical protein
MEISVSTDIEDGMGEETDRIVQILIKCVACRAEFEVSRLVMDVLSILLEREDGRAILPHAELIIRCFSKRFVGPDFDDRPEVAAQLKLSEMKITPTGSVKQGMYMNKHKYVCIYVYLNIYRWVFMYICIYIKII